MADRVESTTARGDVSLRDLESAASKFGRPLRVAPRFTRPEGRDRGAVDATDAVYGTRTLKRRRSTKAEMAAFRDMLWEIVQEAQPCTVRQAYYLAVSRGLIDKDTGQSRTGYQRITKAILEMRESGAIPWDWIADNTRWVRRANTFVSPQSVLTATARHYRIDLWRGQNVRVEVWCESDSISGVIVDETAALGVGLYPCRGQASAGYIHDAAIEHAQAEKPVHVLYIGDWDPSGLAIGRSVRERLQRYLPSVGGGDIVLHFARLAVQPETIAEHSLLGHRTNRRDPHFGAFEQECRRYGLPVESVEVEAVPPAALRQLVGDSIRGFIEPESWNALLGVEKAERESLAAIAKNYPSLARGLGR